MGFYKIILGFIFIVFSNMGHASSWVEGNKLTLQGLDKITARIETFEVYVQIDCQKLSLMVGCLHLVLL